MERQKINYDYTTKLDLLVYSHVEDPENNVFKSGTALYILRKLCAVT